MTAKNDELTHTLFAEQFPQTKKKEKENYEK
jgi:hypothetical protein